MVQDLTKITPTLAPGDKLFMRQEALKFAVQAFHGQGAKVIVKGATEFENFLKGDLK